jgi:hypothetical protein
MAYVRIVHTRMPYKQTDDYILMAYILMAFKLIANTLLSSGMSVLVFGRNVAYFPVMQ